MAELAKLPAHITVVAYTPKWKDWLDSPQASYFPPVFEPAINSWYVNEPGTNNVTTVPHDQYWKHRKGK